MKNVKRIYESGEYEVKYLRKNFLIFSWLEKVSAFKLSNDIIIEVSQTSFPPDKIVVFGADGTELTYTLSEENKK